MPTKDARDEVLEMAKKITKSEILKLARTDGPQFAHDLLLLGGPDLYDGDYGEYSDMLNELSEGAR